MKIKTLSIINYKCHKNIANLPFHDLTTVIGENDSGKTTVIDFLEIMLTNAIPEKEDFYRCIITNPSDGTQKEVVEKQIEGIIEFTLDEVEKEALKEYIDEGTRFILKRVFTEDSNTTYIRSKKYNDSRFYKYEDMNANELKAFLSDLGIEPQSNQDLRKECVKSYIQNEEIPHTYDWIEMNFSKIKIYLPKLIRYNVDDYKNPNNMIYKVLQEVFQNELYVKDEYGNKHFKDESLSNIIASVEDKIREAAQQFKKHIQKYNDKILDITIEPEVDLSSGLKQSAIMVKDETGIYHYLDNRGFGTKKRIYMAIFEWNREVIANIEQNYTIRCYDEPDNSLHIEAQRKLYKTIRSIVEDTDQKNQVLICTHSLFMIDTAPAYSINLLKRNEKGSTNVEYLSSFGDSEIQNFIELMCREMGLPNSHIFFEKCFIVLEGKTEMNFLPLAYKKLYKSSLAEDGITLINLEGNGAATNFLKLLMKNKENLTVLFLDNDTTNFRKSKLMSAHNQLVDDMNETEYFQFITKFFDEKVMFNGDKEFEDTFSNDILTRTLNKYRHKNDSSLWNSEEIDYVRKNESKFSDGVIKLVAHNCAPCYLSKPELGTYLGQEINISDIPLMVTNLFTRARTVAGIVD